MLIARPLMQKTRHIHQQIDMLLGVKVDLKAYHTI